jgi:hypothetical protein
MYIASAWGLPRRTRSSKPAVSRPSRPGGGLSAWRASSCGFTVAWRHLDRLIASDSVSGPSLFCLLQPLGGRAGGLIRGRAALSLSSP